MAGLLHQIHYSASLNMTPAELVLLVLLGILAWGGRRRFSWLPMGYSVFLILYVTLLRRAPGYDENIRLTLKLLPNAGLWAGNLLNLVLYIPLGWTAQKYLHSSRKKVIFGGLVLSACCEGIQYITTRGYADVNDILFNTVGAAVGAWLAGRFLLEP